MKTKEFFGKFKSGYLWGNLIAMALVVVGLAFGVKYGLEYYTRHGEKIKVPDLSKMTSEKAEELLKSDGLLIQVTDSGYNKLLPADCILMQTPAAGAEVKQGHVIYVTVNSPSSPSFPIPDIADNSSFREAEAKLMALGFKLLPPKYIVGEKDWVYGVMCRGRRLSYGELVSIGTPLTLIVGNGLYGVDEDGDVVEPEGLGDDVPIEYQESPDEPTEVKEEPVIYE